MAKEIVSLSEAKKHLFKEMGLGLEISGTFQENAIGSSFMSGYAVGPNISVSVFRYNIHRAYLRLGYLFMGRGRDSGTKQLRVKTSYQRFDIIAGYDICLSYFVAGLYLGPTMTIVTTDTALNEVVYTIYGEELLFEKVGVIDEKKSTGVSGGFLNGISIGIDLSFLFLDSGKSLLEVRAKGDYIRRGQRDDIVVGAMVLFWPSGFF